MKTSKKLIPVTTTVLAVFLLASSAGADTFLSDSFVTAPSADAPNGVYENDQAFLAAANKDVTGGTTVGYSGSWSPAVGDAGTGLVVASSPGLSSGSVSSSGGAAYFRGNATTDNRMAYRAISSYTGPTSTYFSASLSTNLIDDDSTSLVAFSNISGDGIARANNIFSNGATGYYNGVAMGFVGDGSGAMDLVLRYRTATASVYADEILVTGVSLNTNYTVTGRINWESEPSLRDGFTVWVNPDSITEPISGGTDLIGFLGDSTNIDSVYLLQNNFGTVLSEAVIMDEIRLGSSWNDLAPIPEPSQAATLIGLVTAGVLLIRRRRVG